MVSLDASLGWYIAWKNRVLGRRGGDSSGLIGPLMNQHSVSKAGIRVGAKERYSSDLFSEYCKAKASKSSRIGVTIAANSFLCLLSRLSSSFLALVRALQCLDAVLSFICTHAATSLKYYCSGLGS